MNDRTLEEAMEDEDRCEMHPVTQEQILELWKAVAVTAAVMCLGFCVLFYRMIYG